MSHPTDRNLLVGILALQMDFVSRDQLLAAMNAWILQKDKPLEQILFDNEALAAETMELLRALVAIPFADSLACLPGGVVRTT